MHNGGTGAINFVIHDYVTENELVVFVYSTPSVHDDWLRLTTSLSR